MQLRLLNVAFAVCASAMMLFASTSCSGEKTFLRGEVEVNGKQLLRDGQPWIPHGFYQIAFEVAPANLSRADHQFWAT